MLGKGATKICERINNSPDLEHIKNKELTLQRGWLKGVAAFDILPRVPSDQAVTAVWGLVDVIAQQLLP
ncbi:hypothetical protein P7K49_024138 [Saguinus oedipus]|uniref:Uncharacterized protein n=1 Tax=Saguinus oedipus TaxID=9490 RepID=A0ABQ9UNN7_SAGOE|nr:hypothetical protein P7K49_024138 [Saguinus oedipus]